MNSFEWVIRMTAAAITDRAALMRFDWLLTGVIVGGTLWSAHRLARDLSAQLAVRWRSFRRRSVGFRALVWIGLFWVGWRVLRLGWRPFLGYSLIFAGLILWAAVAARSRRS